MRAMDGCIRCHGPLDSEGQCSICDAPGSLEERVLDAVLRDIDERGYTVGDGRKLPPLRRTILPTERATILAGVRSVIEAEHTREPAPRRAVEIDYTNHRGDRRWRRVEPVRFYFGRSRWHTTPPIQWLMEAVDLERDGDTQNVLRVFAMDHIHGWRPAQ